jgi:hypothetical protein
MPSHIMILDLRVRVCVCTDKPCDAQSGERMTDAPEKDELHKNARGC